MNVRDAAVPLTMQRLRELMLWHGKDERNLPPAETLVNLSRDTVAAIAQLQSARAELADLRAALAQLFWTCESSTLRTALLTALGPPPECAEVTAAQPELGWQASPNGLPLPALAQDSQGHPRAQRAAG